MSYDEKILEFLAQPENLPVAMQVADYVQQLREKTHQDFWSMFSDEAIARLESSEYIDDWKIISPPPDRWDKSWERIHLRPRNLPSSDRPILSVTLEQGTPNFDFVLYYGARWEPEGIKDYASKSHDSLIQKLEEMQITQSNNIWTRWNYMGYKARGGQFIMRMTKDPDSLVDEILDKYWKLFQEVQELVWTVNQELQG